MGNLNDQKRELTRKMLIAMVNQGCDEAQQFGTPSIYWDYLLKFMNSVLSELKREVDQDARNNAPGGVSYPSQTGKKSYQPE